jgi:succinoglycan biosynthesis protein ExoM
MTTPSKPALTLVVMPTCDRPAALQRALAGWQNLHAPAESDLAFLVVDNGPDFTKTHAIVTAFGDLCPWPVHYIAEHERGIAGARNHTLDHAIKIDATYLVGHDDDEVPDPEWAQFMVAELRKSGAAIVGGPVTCAAIPGRALTRVQRWMLGAIQEDWDDTYARKRTALAQAGPAAVTNIYTGNFGLNMSQVRAAGVRFDPQKRFSGGEDSDFCARLLATGVTASWATNAHLTEYQPPHRLSPRYIITRNADFSAVWARYGPEGELRYALHALDELFDMVRFSPWIIFGGRKWKMYFLQRLGRFLGHSQSLFGIRSDHYAPKRDAFR